MATRHRTRRFVARICSWNCWLTAYIVGLLLLDERDGNLFPVPDPIADMPGGVDDVPCVGHHLLLASGVGVLYQHERLVGRDDIEDGLKLRVRQVDRKSVV